MKYKLIIKNDSIRRELLENRIITEQQANNMITEDELLAWFADLDRDQADEDRQLQTILYN